MRTLTLALGLTFLLAPPLAARGWRRDISHRPRATLDGRDAAHLARLRAHIQAQEAPWSLAYAHLRDLAETGQVRAHGSWGWKGQPDKWAALYGQEVQNGLIARAKAAVVYLATQGVDPPWRPLPKLPGQATSQGWLTQQAAEAARAIEGLYDDWPGWRGWSVLNRGIVSAESLMVHAQAWDLLAALPSGLRPRLDAAQEKVTNLAEDHCFYGRLLDVDKTNHPIRLNAGLASAGVIMNQHDRYRWWKPWTWDADTSEWVERGEQRLDPERRGSALRHQIESGAYGEGTSYFNYAASLYAAFHWSYQRAGGSGFRPLVSARLDRVDRWGAAIRLPDGRRPSVDNAPLSRFGHAAYLVNRLPQGSRGADQRRVLGWDWVDQGYPEITGARALELLSAWDPDAADLAAIAGTARPAQSVFLREEGTAVLRAGPGAGDACAVFLAEHGSAREAGGGHEDVDPLAFALFAEEDALALDPGYAGWGSVGQTHAAEHHNVVLIDGQGPRTPGRPLWVLPWKARDADAFLDPSGPRAWDGRALDSVSGTSEYCRARIERTVTLLRGRALVIEDLVDPRRTCDVTVQLHAGGGGTKPGRAALSPLGLSFLTLKKAVPVEVALASTRGSPRLALGQARDAVSGDFSPGGRDQHAVLRGTVRADRVRVLTLVTWGPAGAAAPPLPVRLLDRPGATALLGVSGSGTRVIAAAQEAPASLVLPASAQTPRIETDGTSLIVALENGAVVAAVAHDATVLQVDTATPLRLSGTSRGTLRYDP